MNMTEARATSRLLHALAAPSRSTRSGRYWSLRPPIFAKTSLAPPVGKLLQRCAAFRPGELTGPTATAKYTLRLLARRNLQLRIEVKDLGEQIRLLTVAAAPQLLEVFGIGSDGAARLLVSRLPGPSRW